MAERVAIRCDGGDIIGAGHVGRCLPIAATMRDRGIDVVLVGRFDGVAAWLVERSGLPVAAPGHGPCGLDAGHWDGAVLDLYLPDADEVCAVAHALPVATVGEATRCPDAGTWVDFHVGTEPATGPRRLGGSAFAPVDPRFADIAREPRHDVVRILVVAGGSAGLVPIAGALAAATAHVFPAAKVLAPAAVATAADAGVEALAAPVDLAAVAAGVDLAVTGASMTLYELACAGVPCVAVGLVENQRVVLEGCTATGIALAVDGLNADPIAALRDALGSARSLEVRRRLSATARSLVDGRGAARVADALLAAWTRG